MFEPLIRQVQNTETVSRTGKVENIVGMSIEASGGRAAVGDICRIYNGESGKQVPAEVVGFKNDHILLMPYEDMSGISAGNFVRNTGRQLTLRIGSFLRGRIINALGHPTVNEFSSFVNISPPNAAYKINSLIQKGYVTKEQSPDDKREYHLSVTQKYFDYCNISQRYLTTVLDRVKERFPQEDVDKLEEMLDVISGELMPELDPGVPVQSHPAS